MDPLLLELFALDTQSLLLFRISASIFLLFEVDNLAIEDFYIGYIGRISRTYEFLIERIEREYLIDVRREMGERLSYVRNILLYGLFCIFDIIEKLTRDEFIEYAPIILFPIGISFCIMYFSSGIDHLVIDIAIGDDDAIELFS